ncbi:DNA (cytosine-5-)-methyltransferase [Povalibacter sp.]|uniref:DNA (cytosine-5-)-methyltransferase n=1 Tax=Povalibacter sp. TaxID=1962978 RepID=UPI002F415D13
MATPIDAFEMLRHARKRFSQAEIAKICDKDARTVRRWEKGEVEPPSLIVPALKAALDTGNGVSSPADFTFIDLFAGIGGIRAGFESAGGECVFTSEWNKWAVSTYVANFGENHPINGDITQVKSPTDEIPDHDVLLAGFPCQPFSIAGVSKKNALGRPHGFECLTQGTLFYDVARIIAAKKPAAFLLENVKNLLSHDKGNTFRTILSVLKDELKYHVDYKVIDGQAWTPQHRERIIIVGFREKTSFSWDALKIPDQGPKLRAILHREDGTEPSLPHDANRYVTPDGEVHHKYTLTANLWRYLQDYAEKHRQKGNGFGFGKVTPDDTARTLSARYYKDGSEILLHRGKGKRPRRLTPRECARLMGFPDTFRIPQTVSDTQAYMQFGNSVVMPVIREVARIMKPEIMLLKEQQTSQGLLFSA